MLEQLGYKIGKMTLLYVTEIESKPKTKKILVSDLGDLTEELKDFPKATEYNIANFFTDEFFETKKVVHLPLKFKN